MPRPRFDNSISTGTVLQLLTMLFALWGAASSIRERLVAIETRLDPLWQQYNRGREQQGPEPARFTQEK